VNYRYKGAVFVFGQLEILFSTSSVCSAKRGAGRHMPVGEPLMRTGAQMTSVLSSEGGKSRQPWVAVRCGLVSK
jgi:hypothetical protein